VTVPRLADFVRKMIPKWRTGELSVQEQALAPHLRGNAPLYESLVGLVDSRIRGRASVPVPSDPLMCKAMLERDNELRWLLSRLDTVYRSPVSQPDTDEEPSA